MRAALILAATLALCLAAPGARAQSPVPDFSGIYAPARGMGSVGFMTPLPYRPDVEARAKSIKFEDDPGALCVPRGSHRQIIGAVYWIDIVQSPTRIHLFFNQRSPKQVVYLDRSDHPKDLKPSYYGHSIGRFEGDTLVVETVGEDASTYLETPAAARGVIVHSDALKVTYRIRKTGGRGGDEFIEVFTTIDDPSTFTQPLSTTGYFRKLPAGSEQMEYVCEEGLQLEGDF